MKKVFLGLMAMVTFALVGCKGGDTPTPPDPPTPDPQEEVPEVSAPAADKMLLLIRVDKEENKKVCNGVAIRGAMTDYGSGSPILFTKVANTETWYQAEMPAYDNVQFFHCKVLIAAEDGSASYDHEAKEGAYEFIEGLGTESLLEIADDYGTANCLNVIEGAQVGGKVLYVHVGAFKGSPCVAKSSYKITLKMAYKGDDAAGPAVSGSFNSWGITAMDKVNDEEWTVTVDAQEGNEFKFQGGNGGWSNEIEEYTVDPETGEGAWAKQNNKQLGSELNVVFDYTDATKYRWSKAAPVVVTGEVWIKCSSNGWTYEKMNETAVAGTFNYAATVTDAGNIGANIAVDAAGTGETWYDLGDMSAAAHGLNEGDAYMYTFVQTEGPVGTLSVAPADK